VTIAAGPSKERSFRPYHNRAVSSCDRGYRGIQRDLKPVGEHPWQSIVAARDHVLVAAGVIAGVKCLSGQLICAGSVLVLDLGGDVKSQPGVVGI
jgi:hypothetical protein